MPAGIKRRDFLLSALAGMAASTVACAAESSSSNHAVGSIGKFPFPGAVVDMDFTRDRYFGAGLSDLAVRNATGGFAIDSSGLWHRFAPNTLRKTDLGLLLEQHQTNLALWSRDLSNPVWVRNNMSVTPTGSIVGADGTKNGSRLTAKADKATLIQTLHYKYNKATYTTSWRSMPNTNYGNLDYHYGQGPQLAMRIKRVSGSGKIGMTLNGQTYVDVTSIVDAGSGTGWTNPSFPLWSRAMIAGIQLGTSGDVIDVDLVEWEDQNVQSVAPFSPWPTTSEAMLRDTDTIEVNPASKLYSALGRNKTFTLYAEAYNAMCDNPMFIVWQGGCRLHGRGGGSPNGAGYIEYDNPHYSKKGAKAAIKWSIEAKLGDQRFSNYAWPEIGDKNTSNLQEILQTGVISRSVWTWDRATGIGSVVARNDSTGPGTVVTGRVNHDYATGKLFLGCTGDRIPVNLAGYLRRIIVFSTIPADHGSSMEVPVAGATYWRKRKK